MVPIEKDNKRIDWNGIRAEYVGGGIGQRKLAEKHGLKYETLRRRADTEHWVELRAKAEREVNAKLTQKIAEAAADNATLAADIKHKLLMRLKRIEEKYPMDATEVRSRSGNSTAIFRIKDLTAAYKDLTEDIQAVANTDIEDLSPLVELLK